MNTITRIDKITNEIIHKKDSKIILILRHSDREKILDVRKSSKAALTEEGIDIAKKLGANLPNDFQYRFFHSHVARCENTARHICHEAINAGINAIVLGEREYLGGFFMKDVEKVLEIANQMWGPEFILRWYEGKIDETSIMPFKSASKYILNKVISETNTNKEKEIDIHITHDWNMMLFMFHIFNWSDNTLKWPYYLEPIVIMVQNSNIFVKYENERRKLNINY